MNQQHSKETQKFNSLPLGIIVGIVLPILSFLVYYLSRFSSDFDFVSFMKMAYEGKKLVQSASIAVFTNLVGFLVFEKTNRLTAAKGVLNVTIVFAVIIFILRLLA